MDGTLYVGVDGGGTHCRARIRDAAGRLVGEGQGGPANARLGAATAMGSVVQAARAAAAAGGVGEAALARASVFMGLAGAIDDGRRKALLAEPHPFSQVVVDTDAYIAWAGAHGGRDGGIVIVGTGSAGLAVVKGRRFDVGGWGNVISDDGSGNEIGQQAVRRALWALDGMAAMTPLAAVILDRFDRDQNKMVTWADQARPTDFAQFAPLVLEHAARGDALGRAVMEHAGTGIARIARRLLDVGAPAIALLGGLAAPVTPWLPPAIQSRLVAAEADALEGAILLARQSAVAEARA
ncbi:MAG TPA: BadF/BadG/BcrA/BcrD ATPase family protein [Dongiaceae bacterium]|nr:BadF/BadG/BcrA/BcrD ATPase family protein [Dongiaceae bacterium]